LGRIGILAAESPTTPGRVFVLGLEESMDWDMILRAVGVLIGAAGTIYQITRRDPRWRATLKADIEILNLLDDGESKEIIKRNVDRVVQSRYPVRAVEEGVETKRRSVRVYNVSNLVIGIIFLVGFGYWTFSLVEDGWNWWAILTGFFAFGGLGNIMMAFDRQYE
jgi:hypothetical protein